MRDPLFRIICVPTVLTGAPEGWAGGLLGDGDLALAAGEGGPVGVKEVGEALGVPAVAVLCDDADATAKAFAGSFPLVWVAPGFSDEARAWAERRGPMTLLVETGDALSEDDRRRIERFVGILDRQAD
jgi:hypothetical protein